MNLDENELNICIEAIQIAGTELHRKIDSRHYDHERLPWHRNERAKEKDALIELEMKLKKAWKAAVLEVAV